MLQHFMLRAFRGYRNEANEALVLKAYQSKRVSASAEEALLHAMKTALLSSEFLYRMEMVRGKVRSYNLSEYELASRLAYFLWGTMPDDELLRLAKRGELSSHDALLGQVQRMLQSPKRISLSEDFGLVWVVCIFWWFFLK